MKYKIYVQDENGKKYWTNRNGGFYSSGFTEVTETTAPALDLENALMVISHWQRPEYIGCKMIVSIHLMLIQD